MIPLHFWANSNKIETIAKFDQDKSMKDCLYQLNKLEEGRLLAMHHQEVQKQQ
jgi:hypothetical protein